MAPEALRRALVQAGIDAKRARAEVKAADAHPYVVAGKRLARQKARLESLLEAYRGLYRQSGKHQRIEVREGLAPEEFFERYYFGHRPVVLRGMMADWPCLTRWSPAFFRERLGEVEIEIMAGRDANPDHETMPDEHRTKVTLGEYVDRIVSGGETNDYYLVTRNGFWEREEVRALDADLRAPRGIIDPRLEPEDVELLLGPAGTVTPLHHDPVNVLLGQVFGRKRVLLAPSFELPRMYLRRGFYSRVDASRPDYERFPEFRGASVLDLVLEPGELLFIPVGWWHQVHALDVAATVTFHRFAIPGGNSFWEPPEWSPLEDPE